MTTRYVTLAGAGSQNGLSWANAAAWTSLGSVITAAANDDTILVEAGVVYPVLPSNVHLAKRLNWRGQYQDGSDGSPIITSNRAWPWPDNGMWTNTIAGVPQYTAAIEGSTMFILDTGGLGSTFTFFAWRNLKHFIQVGLSAATDIGTVTFTDCRSKNCSTAYVHTVGSNDGQVAVTLVRCHATGYSLKGVRNFASINVSRSVFNSRNQFHTPPSQAAGFHIQDYVVGQMTTRPTCTVSFCAFIGHGPLIPNDAISPPTDYQQGDGFVCEETVRTLIVTDCMCVGAADRGIDLKCGGTIKRYFTKNCGFGIANHNESVEVFVSESYFGPCRRFQAETIQVANIQAAGWLTVTNSYIDCEMAPVNPAPTSYLNGSQPLYIAAKGEINAMGTQTLAVNPFRVGRLFLANSTLKRASAATESITASSNDTGRNIAIMGLTPGSSHSFTVRAVNASGIEGVDGIAKAVTLPAAYTHGDMTPPTTPGQPTASNITATSVDLIWAGSTDAVGVLGYAVYIDGVISAFVGNPENFRRINNLVPATTYSIQIAAWDFTNNLSALSTARSVTTSAGSPANPAIGAGPEIAPVSNPSPHPLATTAYGPTWAVLTWPTSVTNAVSYRIYDSGVLVGQTFVAANSTPIFTKTNCIDILV